MEFRSKNTDFILLNNYCVFILHIVTNTLLLYGCRKHNVEYYTQSQPSFLCVKHNKINDWDRTNNHLVCKRTLNQLV